MNEDDDSIHKQIQLDGRESEPKATEGGEPVGPIKQFYCDLVLVLTEPKLFFESRFSETSLSYALAFGIIVNWIAAALSWLTRTIRHETIFDSLIKMRETLQELPFWKNVPDNFWAHQHHACMGLRDIRDSRFSFSNTHSFHVLRHSSFARVPDAHSKK